MKNFLMLRGEYDANNKRNIKDDTDCWLQIFAELVGEDNHGYIWYDSKKERMFHYKRNIWIVTKSVDDLRHVDYLFCRGNHPVYNKIIKKCTNAYKILYGAGIRTFPQDKIHYDMILVDCVEDLKKGKKKSKIVLWTKPAARQFKPMNMEKKYDICYIANGSQAKIKGIKWVYKTVPSNLSVFHLGNRSKYISPSNVKCRQVLRKDMPEMINQCKIGTVPYTSYDSAPRAISEMLACGLPVVCLDTVRHNYMCYIENKKSFWDKVEHLLKKNIVPIGKSYMKEAVNLIKEHIK